MNGLSNSIEGVNGQISTIQGTLANLQGEVVSAVLTGADDVVPHTLGRIPGGAIVIQSDNNTLFACINTSENDVTMRSGGAANVVIWIV
ncbi:MAG: hypothetical protein HKP37_01055 [Boseongicola sp.]|nr:hypothetical protein [Boseongicola sp.]